MMQMKKNLFSIRRELSEYQIMKTEFFNLLFLAYI
jgi:hypothetical protein